MANKVIKHYYDESMSSVDYPSRLVEPDKTKSISEMSLIEVRRMLERLRSEREVQSTIRDLKRNSGEIDTYEQPFKIDTTTPINQLYHHGIPGQKWGIRRFQRADGSRTPAGKKRDNRHGKSEDHMKTQSAKKKGPEGLSNEDLKKTNERLRLEQEYKKLTADQITKSESWVKSSLQNAGQQALTDFSKGIMLGSAKLLVKELSPQLANTAFGVKEKKKDD